MFRPEASLIPDNRLRDGHRVREAFEDSLKALDIEYIDMYLMHWPVTHTPDGSRARPFEEHPNFVDVWAEIEKLLDTGKVRAIGVSNFSVTNLEILLKHARVVPVNNQVEMHPFLPQHELKKYCEEKGILLTAYSPLGRGHSLLLSDPNVVKIAESHNVTPAQISISWLVQRGTPPIVKSANVERMKKNITLVKLSPEEMEFLDNIHKKPGSHRSLLAYHKPDGTAVMWTYEQLGWPMTVGGIVKE